MSGGNSKLYLVTVCVHEARQLKGMDSNQMSDAYCTVSVGPTFGSTKSTEIKAKTVNAIWDRSFVFKDVRLTEEQFGREKLSFQVYNKNDFRWNNLIGSKEFTLGNIYRQRKHRYFRTWAALVQPKSPMKPKGYLLITVSILAEGDEAAPEEGDREDREDKMTILKEPNIAFHTYILHVSAYHGDGVLRGLEKDPSPFLACRFNGTVARTAARDNTDSPMWNTRLEIPFTTPLASDSIELQLWSYRFGRPDSFIAQATYNFIQIKLANRAWGPQWVNFYSARHASPVTTVLGGLKDWASGVAGGEERQTEHVGRVLVRMSVTKVDPDLESKLQAVSCNPAPEPAPRAYTLHVVLYSGSEIPVLGGMVMVEVVMGNRRVHSRWANGKNGVFKWQRALETMQVEAPEDVEQAPDVFINVYHRAGSSTRKILYERIPAPKLWPSRKPSAYESSRALRPYFVNGEHNVEKNVEAWSPLWRPLKHARPDSAAQASGAGYLLCSIGFGPRQTFDYLYKEKDPNGVQIVPGCRRSGSEQKLVLRAYVHQASNLPRTSRKGNSSPFVVVRWASKNARVGARVAIDPRHNQEDHASTLFPIWMKQVEIAPSRVMDKEHAPSVTLMVYDSKSGVGGYTLLGQCTVLAKHILKNQGRPFRYRLHMGDAQPGAAGGMSSQSAHSLGEASDTEPYITCALALEERRSSKSRRRGRGRRDDHQPDRQVPDMWEKPSAPVPGAVKDHCVEHAVKVDVLGLRSILPKMQGSVAGKRPCVVLSIPSLEGIKYGRPQRKGGGEEKKEERLWSRYVLACDDVVESGQCQAANIMKSVLFGKDSKSKVQLPLVNPAAVALRVQAYTDSIEKVEGWEPRGKLLGTAFLPLVDVLQRRADLARRKRGLGSAQRGRKTNLEEFLDAAPPFYHPAMKHGNDDDEWGPRRRQYGGGGRGEEEEKKHEEGGAHGSGHGGENGGDEGEAYNKFYLDLEPDQLNVRVMAKDEYDQLNTEDEEQVKFSQREREAAERNPDLFDIDLFRCDGSRPDGGMHRTLRVKAFVRVVSLESGHGLDRFKQRAQLEEERQRRKEALEEQRRKQQLEADQGETTGGKGSGDSDNDDGDHLHSDDDEDDYMPSLQVRGTKYAEDAFETLSRVDLLEPWRGMYKPNRRYIARMYVYTGVNLTPRVPMAFRDGMRRSNHNTANPYFKLSNGKGGQQNVNTRHEAKQDTLNPQFYQVYQLKTHLPVHHELRLEMWTKEDWVYGKIENDELIGSATVDLEDRLMRQQYTGGKQFITLHKPGSETPQGMVLVRLDMMSEEQALKQKADELSPPKQRPYQLRMVIWDTNNVRRLGARLNSKIDQRLYVTSNFDGSVGGDVVKETDVSWGCQATAEWNHRFVWNVSLPAKIPRIKISIWDERMFSDLEGTALGEVLYNMQPFFSEGLQLGEPMHHQSKRKVNVYHPNFPGAVLGSVQIELWLLEQLEADRNPVGEGQKEPNRDPFLPDPFRNPAPWMIGTRGLDWLHSRRYMIIVCLCLIIFIPLALPILWTAAKGLF